MGQIIRYMFGFFLGALLFITLLNFELLVTAWTRQIIRYMFEHGE